MFWRPPLYTAPVGFLIKWHFQARSAPLVRGLSMSEPNAPTPPGADDIPFEAAQDLQFEQAEYRHPPRRARSAVSAISPSPTSTSRSEARSSAEPVEGGSSNRFAAAPGWAEWPRRPSWDGGRGGRWCPLLCDHPHHWNQFQPDRHPRGLHGRPSRPGRHGQPGRTVLPVPRRLLDVFVDRGYVPSLPGRRVAQTGGPQG